MQMAPWPQAACSAAQRAIARQQSNVLTSARSRSSLGCVAFLSLQLEALSLTAPLMVRTTLEQICWTSSGRCRWRDGELTHFSSVAFVSALLCSLLGIMGPREVQHTQAPAPAAADAASSSTASRSGRCQSQSAQFASCMKDNQGSIASCQFLFDSLSQCQREEREEM